MKYVAIRIFRTWSYVFWVFLRKICYKKYEKRILLAKYAKGREKNLKCATPLKSVSSPPVMKGFQCSQLRHESLIDSSKMKTEFVRGRIF